MTMCACIILIGASLSEPHTSVIALRVVCVCICMFVCVWPYTGNLNGTNGYKGTYTRIFQICTCASSTFTQKTLNSTPMDLQNATEDSSPCNLTLMNRAHALGVSVGEARDRRAFARVQRDCVGYMELRLKLKYTWQLIPCLPVQIIDGRLPTGSTNFDYDGGRGRFS